VLTSHASLSGRGLEVDRPGCSAAGEFDHPPLARAYSGDIEMKRWASGPAAGWIAFDLRNGL
jgi:hypothetical protein